MSLQETPRSSSLATQNSEPEQVQPENDQPIQLPEDTAAETIQQQETAEEPASEGAGDLTTPEDVEAGSVDEMNVPEDANPETQVESKMPEEGLPDSVPSDLDLVLPESGSPPPVLNTPSDVPEDSASRSDVPQDSPGVDDTNLLSNIPIVTGGWAGGGESDDQRNNSPADQFRLPDDFDEQLRSAIQPQMDGLQQAINERVGDLIDENAILASLSMIPE